MDKFLKKHKLLKLTQEEIETTNGLASIKQIELIIKNLPRKKTPNLEVFIGKFYQAFKK